MMYFKLPFIKQFIKFGLVGLLNNVLFYVVYWVLLKNGFHYQVANVIGFSASIVNAYMWNNSFVFKSEQNRWISKFVKTYVTYASTGILLNGILLFLWIDIIGISEIIAPIISLVLTIPLNFFMNKYWVYK